MENKKFEEMIEELETISRDLEDGKLSLEDSLTRFEYGMKISKQCSDILEDAEKRISILIKNNSGKIEEKDFNVE